MKNSELEALVDEETRLLHSFIDDELKIPNSFSRQDLGSYFLARLDEASAALAGRDVEEVEQEQENAKKEDGIFDKLCQSVPNVPVGCLQVISLALGGLGALHDQEGRFIKNNESEVIRTLMVANFARGIAENKFNSMGSQAVLTCMFMTRKRTHHLAHAIEDAKKRCSDLTDTGGVWAALASMARAKSHGLIGVTPKGIQYLDANDEPKEFSKKQLTAYLMGSNLNRKRPRKSA